MAFVNEIEKQIVVKVVYYGTDLAGKRSTFRFLHDMLEEGKRGRLLKLTRGGDAVLFLDGAPEDLEKIGPYSPRVHLYTPLNDIQDPATLAALFRGTDAAVFVADAQEERLDENRRALDAMKGVLARLETAWESFPFVMQFDKLDLPGALSEEDLDEELNERNVPFYAANAVTGVRIEETFTAAAKLGLRKIAAEFKARSFKGWFKFTSSEALLKKNFDALEDYAQEMEREAFEPAGFDEAKNEFAALDEKSDFAELDALLEETADAPSPQGGGVDGAEDAAQAGLDALFSQSGEDEDAGEADPLAGGAGGDPEALAESIQTPLRRGAAKVAPSKEAPDFAATIVAGRKTAATSAIAGGGGDPAMGRTVRVNRAALVDVEKAAKSLGFGDEEDDAQEGEETTVTATLSRGEDGIHTLTVPLTLPPSTGRKATLKLRLEIAYKT